MKVKEVLGNDLVYYMIENKPYGFEIYVVNLKTDSIQEYFTFFGKVPPAPQIMYLNGYID